MKIDTGEKNLERYQNTWEIQRLHWQQQFVIEGNTNQFHTDTKTLVQ